MSLQSSVAGVFAVGDVRSGSIKRVDGGCRASSKAAGPPQAAAVHGGCVSAPRLARQDQYGGRGVGRYRLPIGGQRNVPEQVVSHIHRKKPKGRAMPETMRRAKKPNRKSARVSSMCSRSKRIGWGYSSELSGSPEQRPRSEWPISSTTSTLYLPAQDRRRMTGLC